MGVKLHEESKYFIRIFATRPYFAARLYAKSAKPACVHTNPNCHQGTRGPPEWAEIIDLMMFSSAKKPIPKTFLRKELRLFENRIKIALFSIFRDF